MSNKFVLKFRCVHCGHLSDTDEDNCSQCGGYGWPKAAPPAGEETERARAGKAWQGENGLGGMLQHDAYIRGWLARALAGDGKEGKR